MEETLKRIQSEHKGVIGVIVANHEGVILRHTLSENNDSSEYTNVITEIVERAKAALKDNDELTFLKIRTKKTEFVVVPGKDTLHLFFLTLVSLWNLL